MVGDETSEARLYSRVKLQSGAKLAITLPRASRRGLEVVLRIDVRIEVAFFRRAGIQSYVLRRSLAV